MSDAYFIRFRGHIQGPFSADRLRELARRGAFGRLHEVSEDRQIWRRASDYPDLLPLPATSADRRRSTGQVEPVSNHTAAATPHDDYGLSKAAEPTEESRSTGSGNEKPAAWYYTDGAREIGPVSFEELQAVASRGQLLAADLVWTEGMDQWCEAGRVSGLAFVSSVADTGPEPTHRTSGMAIASLICALLGFTILPGLGSLLAVVFGHLAVSQIKKSKSKMGGMGLAVTGMALGYVVLIVTLVTLIAAILWLLLVTQPPPTVSFAR